MPRALLRAAIDELGGRGFRRVRAWPRTDESESAEMSLFHGPRALYLSEGFAPVRERGHLTVMEKRPRIDLFSNDISPTQMPCALAVV